MIRYPWPPRTTLHYSTRISPRFPWSGAPGGCTTTLAVGGDVGLHSHLHAGLGLDRRRHELVAGDCHHSARQSDRADPHATQRACRREIRHSVSGVGARVVRSARRQCSGGAARAGGLRVVRHPDLDRRAGHLLHAAHPVAGGGRHRRRHLDLLLRLLGAEHRGDLARHRHHQVPGRHRRAVHAGDRAAAAVVDHAQGRRLWTGAERAQQVPVHGRIRALLHPFAHRNGGVLGHGGAEYSGFHALRQIAEGAEPWARRWACP